MQISDPSLGYLVNRTSVRVHVEWLMSCLLFQSTYHHYDDVTRVQTYQMRQDIRNLRLENEILERRLMSYEDTAGIGILPDGTEVVNVDVYPGAAAAVAKSASVRSKKMF